MESIETSAAIIFKAGTFRELQPQVSEASFAFIENWPAEECVPLNVQYYFRHALGCLEEFIRLKTRDPRQRKKGVCLCQRDDAVRNTIYTKFPLIKIRHTVLLSTFRQVSDDVDVFGEARP